MGRNSLDNFVVNVSEFYGSAACGRLTLVEKWIYLGLLADFWNGRCEGLLWTDYKHLLSFKSEQKRVFSVLTKTFFEKDGKWHNKVAKERWDEACARREERARSGRKGGSATSLLIAKGKLRRPSSSSSSSSSSSTSNTILSSLLESSSARAREGEKEMVFCKQNFKRASLRDAKKVLAFASEILKDENLTTRECDVILALAARCYRESKRKNSTMKNPVAVFVSRVRTRDPAYILEGVRPDDENWASRAKKEACYEAEQQVDLGATRGALPNWLLNITRGTESEGAGGET